MTQWQACYLPPDPAIWQDQHNHSRPASFSQHVRSIDLLEQIPNKTNQTTFALLGFRCDEGITRDEGRVGAYDGPLAIKQQLAKLPIQKLNFDCYDLGDVYCQDHKRS